MRLRHTRVSVWELCPMQRAVVAYIYLLLQMQLPICPCLILNLYLFYAFL